MLILNKEKCYISFHAKTRLKSYVSNVLVPHFCNESCNKVMGDIAIVLLGFRVALFVV